jgi:cell division GTPase FtsZ
MFELMDSYSQSAVIKVLGVGGGGGNAVSHWFKPAWKAWTSFASTPMRRR